MGLEVELVSWDDVYERAAACARQIREDAFQPDLVVAIARGGFVPARLLCDLLDVHALASIKVEHYAAGAKEAGAATIVYPINAELRGKQVLLVDDVNDSGDTLAVARPYLEGFSPAQLAVAVLDQKQRSPVPVEYEGRRVSEWHWITYPWARVEDIAAFIGQLSPCPEQQADIAEALYREHGFRLSDATLRTVLAFGGQ